GTDRVLIACHNEAERKRLGDVLAAGQLAQSDRLRLVTGRVRAGFRMVEIGLVILSDYELFHREETRRIEPRRRLESRAIDSFLRWWRSGRTCSAAGRWIASFAATSASAKPSWRCGLPSKRSTTASKWPCWFPRRF